MTVLDWQRDGAALVAGAMTAQLEALHAWAARIAPDQAGVRLHGDADVRAFTQAPGPLATLVGERLGRPAFPVRALLFDKSPARNWALAWHQDRTVVLVEQRDAPGFGAWTVKQGLLHVAPPTGVLDRMVTARVHLDPVPATNAPLLIAPGSHKRGRVAERDIASVVAACGVHACLADAGDVWLYATPILHASEAASAPSRRRVLQVDYTTDPLPGGLTWLGV